MLTLVLLAHFSPLGRGALLGAGATAFITLVWEAVAAVQDRPDRPDRLGAVMAVFSVVLLGSACCRGWR